MPSDNHFMIKTSNDNFTKRQQDIFSQLSALEVQLGGTHHSPDNRHSGSGSAAAAQRSPDDRRAAATHHSADAIKPAPRQVTKHFRGKQSIFKVPDDPLTKNFLRNLPDFKRHPHKWTRYSLDDVKDDDLSERSNTKTALAFLRELESRKKEEDEEEEDALPSRIAFSKEGANRSSGSALPQAPDVHGVIFKSSKVVMAEYVVGQKARKERKNRKIQADGSNKQLKLDHLYDDEEDN